MNNKHINALQGALKKLNKLEEAYNILQQPKMVFEIKTIIYNVQQVHDDILGTQKKISSDKKDINIDDIINVITAMRYKEERQDAAMKWCKFNSVTPSNVLTLFEVVGKGEEKYIKKELISEWRLPTLEEMKTLHRRKIGKENKHRVIWLNDGSSYSLLKKRISCEPSLEEKSLYKTFFIILVRNGTKSLEFKAIDGLYSFKNANNKAKIFKVVKVKKHRTVNTGSNKSGVRRSTPKKSKSKFMINNMKYVNFHYAFGNVESAPVDSRNFAIRGYIAKSSINPLGVKLKDFELNDTGIINARFYIDSEIKRLGLDIPLRFTVGDYNFIAKYGPRNWVRMSNYKSGFDFDKAKQEVIDRYFDVADKYAIDNSYAKRIIIDNKKQLDTSHFDTKDLISISNYKD